jgi:hypothetical protein
VVFPGTLCAWKGLPVPMKRSAVLLAEIETTGGLVPAETLGETSSAAGAFLPWLMNPLDYGGGEGWKTLASISVMRRPGLRRHQ